MKLFDLQHPWFIPLWRRVLVVGICLMWTGIELTTGDPFWAVLFGALSAYAVWSFFMAFNPRTPDSSAPTDPAPKDK